MGWVFEWIIQGIWQIFVEAAYKKGGWVGAALAVILPPAVIILPLWLIFR
jgi:hypothetical protein